MKRIGILSDTHSCWDDRFALHLRQCDEIWHAGDIGCTDTLRRLEDSTGALVRAVSGNIDHGEVARLCPPTLAWDCEGISCVMTHIGGYPGRYAPGVAELLARHRARIFVAGHSHILKIVRDPALGCLHINPGAAGTHGWQRQRTLVRLSIDAAGPRDLEVIELGKLK